MIDEADAVDTLYNLLVHSAETGEPAQSLTAAFPALKKVYDHEPKPGDLAAPYSMTVFWSATTEEFFDVCIRIYSAPDVSARDAQRAGMTLRPAVEALISDEYGPSAWSTGFDATIGCFVTQVVLSCGRTYMYQ